MAQYHELRLEAWEHETEYDPARPYLNFEEEASRRQVERAEAQVTLEQKRLAELQACLSFIQAECTVLQKKIDVARKTKAALQRECKTIVSSLTE